MNLLLAVLLMFSLLGLADSLLGGRFGIGKEFERGLSMMGSLALSMTGIYCFSILAARSLSGGTAGLFSALPFDPSLIVTSFLAPDMGGYSIASKLARTGRESVFSGVLVSSALGCTLSFSLPIALSSIRKEDTADFMKGIIAGVVTIPAGLLLGGTATGMSAKTLAADLLPIALLCALLCLALWKAPNGTVRVFTVCGSLVLCRIVLNVFGTQLEAVGRRMDVNRYAVLGLLLSLVSSVSMFPLFGRMDWTGKGES